MLSLVCLELPQIASRRMMADADIIILGGGCAGLSLAMRLAELGELAPHTIILEARQQYTNDRTWCFWENNEPSMAFCKALITQRWDKMRVKSNELEVIVNCTQSPYALLPSLAFYDYACGVISRSNRITLLTGSSISSVSQLENSSWSIQTDSQQYTGKTIIDTRLTAKPVRQPFMLWQSFSGVEIECEASVFDMSLVDLMDFHEADTIRTIFTYILPTSPKRGLIEVTIFGVEPVSQAELKSDLERTIKSRVGSVPYRILNTEHGILPMGQPKSIPAEPKSYIRVGLGAGAARPSTGYAFQRIQFWAAACARGLSEGHQLSGHFQDSWLLRTMDNIFLRVIKDRPERAPQLFFDLFKKTDSGSLIRFLSDGGSLREALAIIRALPPLPFLQAGLAAMRETILTAIATISVRLRGRVVR
jgi:lycopene beta-cyclase